MNKNEILRKPCGREWVPGLADIAMITIDMQQGSMYIKPT